MTKAIARKIEITDTGAARDSMMALIERAASDPSFDVQKMVALVEMRDRQLDRAAEEGFNEAMAKAQSAMDPIRRDASNPQTKSKYASFEALDRALRPIYTEHGFALSWNEGTSPKPDHVRVICYVSRGRFTREYHR